MQKVKWYYLAGLLLVFALILTACGDEGTDSDSESNVQPQLNEEVPANIVDTSSDANFSEAISDPIDVNSDDLNFGLGTDVIDLEPQTVQAGDGTILVNVTMPEGYKFNDQAPFQGNFESDTASVNVGEEVAHYQEVLPAMPLEIPVTFSEGQAMVTADLQIYWCEAINETLCFVTSRIVNMPITVDSTADSTVANAVVALTPPE